MSFLKLARERYSVRKYQDREVAEEKLLNVLEAGRIAPSAGNYQPWKFIVIRKRENLEKIYETYPREWFRQALVIIVICGNHKHSWVRGDGKDHCDIDVAIAVDHMTLAATEEGLGTCWICAFDPGKCKQLLGLEDHWEPVAIIPLGYPATKGDPQRHESDRKRLEDVVQWEI